MDEENRKLVAENLESVQQELDSFCSECWKNWACVDCPVDMAKKKLEWLLMESRLRIQNGRIDEDTLYEMEQPCRHMKRVK